MTLTTAQPPQTIGEDDLSALARRFQRLFSWLVWLPLIANLPPALLSMSADKLYPGAMPAASTYAAMIFFWLATDSLGRIGCRKLCRADVHAPALLRTAMVLAAVGCLFVQMKFFRPYMMCVAYILCCWPIPLSLLALPIISLRGLAFVFDSTMDRAVWQQQASLLGADVPVVR